ncbi:hypothetical protein ElyMa_005240500 [Elysia marginata]|uniref:Uncharacterized protein n=1 Tax=Elysia marginata TaxID=1093978 RepID=A0AAV4JXI8_9GAST|nr:hypothetical protein ElyMa_005240500 [Elysia marginata]
MRKLSIGLTGDVSRAQTTVILPPPRFSVIGVRGETLIFYLEVSIVILEGRLSSQLKLPPPPPLCSLCRLSASNQYTLQLAHSSTILPFGLFDPSSRRLRS